jgi:hypothetical protein
MEPDSSILIVCDFAIDEALDQLIVELVRDGFVHA